MYSLWQDLSHHSIIFDLVTRPWSLTLTYFSKNLTLAITYEPWKARLSYFKWYSLWQDLSHHTIIFYLVNLTLIKNFNLGHNWWTVRDQAFIFHMCISCDKTFHIIPVFDLVTWTLTYFSKTLTLAITYNTHSERQDFHTSHEVWLTSQTLYCVTLVILLVNHNRAFIFHNVFLVTRPFTLYHKFWPNDFESHSLKVAISIW